MNSEHYSNWRSVPNFNYHFPDLATACQCAVAEFSKLPRSVFLLIYSPRTGLYILVPWEQFRHLRSDHDANAGIILFRGTFHDYRTLAQHFPPDLFPPSQPHSDNGNPPPHPNPNDGSSGFPDPPAPDNANNPATQEGADPEHIE